MSSDLTDEKVSAFLEAILTHTPSTPDRDYSRLCEAWRQATAADWIWLWLFHDLPDGTSVMQLVAQSRRSPNHSRETFMLNPTSVAAYCARTGSIEVVEEPFQQWSKSVGNVSYSVALAEPLRLMGCKQFLCVPVHLPPLSAKGTQKVPDHMPIIRGVLCLPYKQPAIITEPTLKRLRLMGQVSAQALLNSYQALQRAVLIELNKIAHRYLIDRRRDSEAVSREYASGVIRIICEHLQVKGVSIFYRDSLRGGVQCLATTGLERFSGQPVGNVADAHYSQNEGRTGQCFASGTPLILINGLDHANPPATVELIEGRHELALPATLFPIPLPGGASSIENAAKSLGVIRCKYHFSKLMDGTGLVFDTIELQTLGFIAQQIAPVLETMELNTARERVVSVTKHDLYAPIGTIRHKTFELRINRQIRLDGDYIAVNRYDIYDIGVCTMMCLNLVTQLDADPFSFIPNAKPELISIESRIVAPLKNMLVHFAKEQNDMRIYFAGFTEEFLDVWLDPTLMQRVVFNLITNAVKYGLEGSQVSIIGRVEPEVAFCVDIYNEGSGVQKDDVDKIFTPRYRAPSTANTVFGLGLGLAISRACLGKCGCELQLLNRKDPTIFSIRIPFGLVDRPFQNQPRRT